MGRQAGRVSLWDSPRWPRGAALGTVVLGPVIVATGVTAHYHAVPADRALAALAVSTLLGGGMGLAASSGAGPLWGRPGARRLGDRRATLGLGGLVAGGALGIWLAVTTSWWLLALGVVGTVGAVAVLRLWRSGSAPVRLPALAAGVFLAGLGTAWAELGHLTWIAPVSALMPAALAGALWLAAPQRTQPTGPAGLPQPNWRPVFLSLLAVALAVPLLLTIPGLDGAECFLPWLVAPLGEGPLRNYASPDSALRTRAFRQLAGLVVVACALLAVGVWTG
ncbi:MAG TPA: hypothetical protein VI138_06050 [Candidatus Dormibacteraeota bacterium]